MKQWFAVYTKPKKEAIAEEHHRHRSVIGIVGRLKHDDLEEYVSTAESPALV